MKRKKTLVMWDTVDGLTHSAECPTKKEAMALVKDLKNCPNVIYTDTTVVL
jgi:hypothetical protein